MSSLPSTTSALSFFIAHKIVPLSSCVKRGSNEISACMQTNIDRFLILFLDCRQILAADTTKHCSQQEYQKKRKRISFGEMVEKFAFLQTSLYIFSFLLSKYLLINFFFSLSLAYFSFIENLLIIEFNGFVSYTIFIRIILLKKDLLLFTIFYGVTKICFT